MTLIEAGGRPHLVCGQCQTVVVWPKELASAAKAAIAGIARRDPHSAAELVESRYGLDLREGKALAVHVTRNPGICHRCNSPVAGGETLCSKCHAANLDW
jgi:ribosomal protein L40E